MRCSGAGFQWLMLPRSQLRQWLHGLPKDAKIGLVASLPRLRCHISGPACTCCFLLRPAASWL